MSLRRLLPQKRSNTLPMMASVNEKEEHRPTDDGASGSDGTSVAQNASTAALIAPSAPLPLPSLKVKRVDYYYSRWSKSWKYKNTGEKVTPETIPVGASSGNDQWAAFCFVVVRKLPRKDEGEEPTFQVYIKSPYLLQACKDVIQKQPGLSWNADPLQVGPW